MKTAEMKPSWQWQEVLNGHNLRLRMFTLVVSKIFFIVTIAQLWIRLPRGAVVSELGVFQDLARQSHGQASLALVIVWH